MFAYDLDVARKSAEAAQAALQSSIDPAAVAPFLGAYHNDALGDILLVNLNNRLFVITGGFMSELKSAGHGTYMLYDPPLPGSPLIFTKDNAGRPIINLPFGPDTYLFTKKP